MEQINNDNTIKECSNVLGHQVENTPQLDTSKISLKTEVNPMIVKPCEIQRGVATINATSTAIYTTPTDRDFYLTHATLSVIKDVTATSILSRITALIGGATYPILQIGGITLTVQSECMSLSFPHPIKIDRGTAISCTNSTATGNVTAIGTIGGFLI